MISVDQLNTYDVLARDWTVFTRSALDKLSARAQEGGPKERPSSAAEDAVKASSEAVVAEAAERAPESEGIRSEGGETP